jgi:hypothetical protein
VRELDDQGQETTLVHVPNNLFFQKTIRRHEG